MPISLEETLCDVKIMYNECTDFVTKERLQKLHIDLNKARMHKNKKYNKLLCIPSMLIGVIITIAIIILSFSTSTYADSIDVNITSYHPDKTYTYNKNNLGVGYTKDLNKH